MECKMQNGNNIQVGVNILYCNSFQVDRLCCVPLNYHDRAGILDFRWKRAPILIGERWNGGFECHGGSDRLNGSHSSEGR